MEAPGVESRRTVSVSIGLDRFRMVPPSVTAAPVATSASIGVALSPGRKVENSPDPVRDLLFAALAQWISERDLRNAPAQAA